MATPAFAIVRRRQQPIDDMSLAVGDRSLTKVSISAGVGGKPMRSMVTRRSSCSRDTSAEGCKPAASILARMKRSTGERSQPARASWGSAGRTGLFQAQ